MEPLRRLIMWIGTLDGESIGKNALQMLNASLYNSIVEFIKTNTFSLREFFMKVPEKYIDQVLIKFVSDYEWKLFFEKPQQKREVRAKVAGVSHFMGMLEKIEGHKKVDIQRQVRDEPLRRFERIPVKMNIPLHHSGVFLSHI